MQIMFCLMFRFLNSDCEVIKQMSLLIKNAHLRGNKELVDIYCVQEKIHSVGPALECHADRTIDVHGMLVTPRYVEPHIHLDKVNIMESLPPNKSGTLKEAIELIWKRKQNYTVEDVVERASEVVDMALQAGTMAIRSHVDVDTIGGLKPLEGVLAVREKYKDDIYIQLVNFPQEGIIKDPGTKDLMREAMKRGCDIVGGMPANENTPADSLEHVKFCFDLAEEFDADIDMHVDETDDPFYRTLEMIADETIKRGYHGRVTAGHTCALAAYDDHYADYVMDKVKDAKINMITNPLTNLMLQGRNDKQPIRRGITRVKELLERDVRMSFGQDCVNDTFYPLGNADMLKVANVAAHAAQMSLPSEIEKVYDMITYDAAKILKLENYGLHPGDKANFVVVNADNVREAIALCPARRYVIHNGKLLLESRNEIIRYEA